MVLRERERGNNRYEINHILRPLLKEKTPSPSCIYTILMRYGKNRKTQAMREEKRKIINIIRNESHKPKKVNEVITFVKESGGLTYAQKVMEQYVTEARTLLHAFPDTPYRKSLEHLVQYTIERTK